MNDRLPAARPLIFVTNDDGIQSPGLHVLANSVAHLGDVMIVAPNAQQTAMSRAFPQVEWEFTEIPMTLDTGESVLSYGIEGSPAQAVRGGVLLLAERKPDLLISGINYGENLGAGVTISGTVGAAIEGAAQGIPSLAVSLETEMHHYRSYSDEVQFEVAGHFAARVSEWLLSHGMPRHTDLLKLDVPSRATRVTELRITRLSRQNYFHPEIEALEGRRRFVGLTRQIDVDTLEPDSDVYAVMVDEVVSLTPMTVDLTAEVGIGALQEALAGTRAPA
jgi:5'-nucleotidase